MVVSVYKETDVKKAEKHPLLPNDGKSEEACGTVSVRYNDEDIIFVFECPYSKPLKLPYSAYNDPVWRGEAVEIFICPNADTVHYFEFDSAPNGACYNAQILNVGEPTVYVRSIDNCPVKYNSVISDNFYTMEVRIPFSLILKGDKSPQDVPWLFNAYRISYDDGIKMLALSPTECATFHAPSKFSELRFI